MDRLNLVLAIGGIAATSLAVVVSHYWTKSTARRPRISYVVDDDPIYGPELTPVDVFKLQVSGDVVDRVSRSRLAVWQSRGSGVIDSSAIAENDPVAIRCQNESILHYVIACDSGARNAIELVPNGPSELLVLFDYLEVGHGFIAEVYVTGDRSVEVGGSIKGAEVKRAPWQLISPSHLGGQKPPPRLFLYRLLRALIADSGWRTKLRAVFAVALLVPAVLFQDPWFTLAFALPSGYFAGLLVMSFMLYENKPLPGTISSRRLAPGWQRPSGAEAEQSPKPVPPSSAEAAKPSDRPHDGT